MAIVLNRGEFFGRVVTAAQWEPFRMSETRYARGTFLPGDRADPGGGAGTGSAGHPLSWAFPVIL